MTHKINKIIEAEDGRVFTVSQGNEPPSKLPEHIIDDLIEQGMSREEAENLRPKGFSVRIMRAKHLETDVPVADTTKDLINAIKSKK